MHVNPEVSDPKRISEIPDDEGSEGEERPHWSNDTSLGPSWHGLFKDVGIFTEHEWNFLMCKCLASMGKHNDVARSHRMQIFTYPIWTEIPLADGGSLTTGPSADNQVGFEIGRLPKPQWRIRMFKTIYYSSISRWQQCQLLWLELSFIRWLRMEYLSHPPIFLHLYSRRCLPQLVPHSLVATMSATTSLPHFQRKSMSSLPLILEVRERWTRWREWLLLQRASSILLILVLGPMT